jgi:hypothetical protein
MLHNVRISLITTSSEENKKTDLNMPTTSADVTELEHYEPSLVNCDVSRKKFQCP